MQHHFNTDIAKQYDIITAIMLDNFYYWINKNRANNKNFYNGRYWTFNTNEALAEMFPYLSSRQVRYAIQKMIDNNLIMTDNFNPNKYVRTLYYAITDFGYSILQNCQMYNIYNITDTKTNTIKEIYKENSANAETLAEETEVGIPTTQPLQNEKNSKLLVDSKKEEVFTYIWNICVRKESKEQARKTFAKLMKECRTEDEVTQKGRAIYQNYQIACNQWKEEERDKKFVPLLSSWLNDNVPEKMIKRR